MLELCRKIQFKDFYGKFGNVCCSLASSIYETVQSAFAVNDFAVLQDCCLADLGRKIDAISGISESSIEQLLGVMSSTNYSLTV